ncbi:MAG: AAA family ATPase [Micrococcales bacterium]|nr:AAA family ATPase [Micrococcales bacterium]
MGPVIDASLRDDGNGQVSIDGVVHPVVTGTVAEARAEIVRLIADAAREAGHPLRAMVRDDAGEWPILVHLDGTAQPDSVGRRERVRPFPAAASDAATPDADPVLEETVLREDLGPAPRIVVPTSADPAPSADDAADPAPAATSPTAEAPESEVSAAPVAPASGEEPGQHSARTHAGVTQDRVRRQSFLTHEQTEEPASRGVRGALGRIGIRMGPSDEERLERADVQAVSQHWPGPRIVAVVNGKGGAGKTPTTVMLSAVFARYGGAGVLAWDNNQTRGTLGWRTEQGPHAATLLDLLPQKDRLLGTGAQSADLAHYVHHQTRDRFDVLRSKPMLLAHEQRIEPDDVDAIHAVAAKYYRLIVIDSGNDESDPMWLRMIDHTDQLVIATTTRDDHAEAGALLLEALAERDQRSAELAAHAVVVVTQADSTASARDLERVADGYRAIAREVVAIPFDPAMVDGILRHDALRAATQRAWLGAAAAVARNL